MSYIALIYTPGYLPLSEGVGFSTPREAWQYLLDELDWEWDYYPDDDDAFLDVHTQIHNLDQDKPGTVYGPTPGLNSEHDLGLAYSVDVCEEE